MKISFDQLQRIINSSGYKVNGSVTEIQFAYMLEEDYPNSELFWKNFIVPHTNRIDETITDYEQSIKPREGIADSMHLIGSYHYSIFHNFLFAHGDIQLRNPGFFENFYTHLGTMCDCVEEFLIHVYLIILECRGQKSKALQEFSKEDFLKKADQWYDESYPSLYEHYLCKGKATRIKIIDDTYILEDWFQKHKAWKDYKRFSQLIRQYRNIIVHGHTRPVLVDAFKNEYVPLKEKILEYKKWTDNDKAVKDHKLFESDFILRNRLMVQDLKEMKMTLQALWEKPILEMNELLFTERNSKLLQKYNLSFE